MSTVSSLLGLWARRTRTSLGALPAPYEDDEPRDDDGLIYRLRHWPSLPTAVRTAEVLRLLSVMSHRAVNRRWMLAHSKLEAAQVEALLRRLVAKGDVEVIDIRRLKPAA